jgi:molybdenum cofactor biosynthesis enzyme MoaA
MTTDKCNGRCPFCDVQRQYMCRSEPEPDLNKLKIILFDLYSKNLISKISVTGGEPLLNPERTNSLLRTIFEVNPKAKVDITTNGTRLRNLDELENVLQLNTIHLSRHHYRTSKNNQIFGTKTAERDEIENYAKKYPGQISFNCCLVEGYIDSPQQVEKYIDWAAEIEGLKSAGFISLMEKNDFCKNNTIAENEILHWIDSDLNNFRHDDCYDMDICECKVWERIAKNYKPITAFWWKIEKLELPYCRQLVFTADNRVIVNFNEIAEIKL